MAVARLKMKYTQRFCHLAKNPNIPIGGFIHRGDIIGRMGTTGKSTAPHVHTDGVEGYKAMVYRLSDMEHGFVKPAPRQCALFIDGELFGFSAAEEKSLKERHVRACLITTHYCDPDYKDEEGRLIIHMGYDVVPYNRHMSKKNYDLHWNRRYKGVVLSSGLDDAYGYYINIGYEI